MMEEYEIAIEKLEREHKELLESFKKVGFRYFPKETPLTELEHFISSNNVKDFDLVKKNNSPYLVGNLDDFIVYKEIGSFCYLEKALKQCYNILKENDYDRIKIL